jgi:hypothetical protein
MPRKTARAVETNADVESVTRHNEELREVLFDLLDYMGGSDLEGLQADHPLAKAWALRSKLERG